MQIELKSEEGCTRTFAVTAPPSETGPEFDRIARELLPRVALPGFRHGKVPLGMVKAKFRKEIKEELLGDILPKAAKEIEAQHALKAVVEPYAANIHFDEAEGLTCEIIIEVAPEVKLPDDLSTAVSVLKMEVNQAHIDGAIANLQEDAAVIKPVPDCALEGDFAEVSLCKTLKGKPFKVFRMATAKGEHPLDSLLLGKKEGDSFVFTSEGEGQAKGLAPGEYEASIEKLSRREKPAVGDDLAKHYSCEDMAALTKKVTESMEQRAKAEMLHEQKERILDQLLEKCTFPVPPTQVEKRLQQDVEELITSLANRGIDPEKAGLDWQKLAESRRPGAQRSVRAHYLLKAVAEREHIEVSADEVEDYFKKRVPHAGDDPAAAKKMMASAEKEGKLDALRTAIAQQKALDLLLSRSSVTFTEGQPTPKEGLNAPDTDGSGADKQG